MTTLVVDRSTAVQSVALVDEAAIVGSETLDGSDARSGDWAVRVEDFLRAHGVGRGGRPLERIVVGVGPGSFAGIRSALAFAQGYSIGSRCEPGAPQCEIFGLPSPCAFASDAGGRLAVVGDARRERYWVAPFEDGRLVRDVFQVDREGLSGAVPSDASVTTPDSPRIGDLLRDAFGTRYLGGGSPTAEGLARYMLANPRELRPEPLPIYLNPAVRPD